MIVASVPLPLIFTFSPTVKPKPVFTGGAAEGAATKGAATGDGDTEGAATGGAATGVII